MLTGRAFAMSPRSPHYSDDIIAQMDLIGVGSLPIVILTGLFAGAVMALQMSRALAQYGQVDQTGTLVSISLVRELGPVLTALMMAGRNSSGIASELGSMKVTEQIDAMRALGTDPIQKLVTPRMVATASCCRCSPSWRISSACSAAGSSPAFSWICPASSIGLPRGGRWSGTTWHRDC